MKKIIAPILFGEKGDHIANLHQALIQLLINIDNGEEVENQEFGETTKAALQRFQRAQYLPGSGIVDSATAARLNNQLNLSDEAVYEVSGYVQDRHRKRIATQRVVAFDVDLRGAAVYESVQSLEEIEEVGGFERIGDTETDRNGEYHLWFGQGDFQKAERGLADVVVYVVDDGATAAVNFNQIVGRSRLVFKKEYDRKRRIENLIITLDGERHQAQTDYQDMIRVLTPFLRESDVVLNRLQESENQMTFLAEEVDRDISKVRAMAHAAEISERFRDIDLSQELLYGLGGRKIPLTPFSLASTPIKTLKESLNRAIASNIIAKHTEEEIGLFCTQLQKVMAQESLDRKREESVMEPRKFFDLAFTGKPELHERLLLDLVNHEKGKQDFWENISTLPIFQEQPEQLARLEKVGQLAAFSGFHFPLVETLMSAEDATTMSDFIRIDEGKWREMLDEVGWPDQIQKADDEESKTRYVNSIQENLRAAYPALQVSMMIKQKTLSLRSPEVEPLVSSFLKEESDFDIRTSRVIDFKDRIDEMARDRSDTVIDELKTVQRLFQLSPTPEVMTVLNDSGLHSAYHISRVPRQSFVQQYGGQLGNKQALYVHEKALHIQARNNYTQTMAMEASNGLYPESMWGPQKKEEVQQVIEHYIPNWETLFGRFDICECEHCRSVFSPSAYLVDILQFLKYSTPNQALPQESPLVHLLKRRPDIAHLPLTCENTHTVLPYIDLVNEVMEYYVVHDKLEPATAHDTDQATTEELQAEPQYTMISAYEKLADVVFPFTLPYHQPLDVIHSYLGHQNFKMADLLNQFGDQTDPSLPAYLVAMRLTMSPRQYEVISGSTIEGVTSNIPQWECYGYIAEQVSKFVDGAPTIRPWNDWLIKVPEFLKRSGLSYVELVELIKCRLINPHPEHIKYLEILKYETSFTSQQFYTILDQINNGTQSLSDIPQLLQAVLLTGYDESEFVNWMNNNFDDFKETVTLYEPDSSCDLSTTSLKTIKSIYDPSVGHGITDDRLSLMHRFIRLQRLLEWEFEDLDIVIRSFGKDDIDAETLSHIAILQDIRSTTKLTSDQLAVLWGNIDYHKEKSLYRKLFLNRSLQKIDPVFESDPPNGILVNAQVIRDHLPVIQSALRLSSDEIRLIAIHEGFDLHTDKLELYHLSVFYRYKVLSKSLRLKVDELIDLQKIVQMKAFSSWDSDQNRFVGINPGVTLAFIEKVGKIQRSEFDLTTLRYLFLPEQTSSMKPDPNLISDLYLSIRQDLLQVGNDLQADQNIDTVLLGDRLAMLYEEPLVSVILDLVRGTVEFTTTIPMNIEVAIPDEFSEKLFYQKSTGSLSFKGIMTSEEQTKLINALDPSLSGAIDDLFFQPENCINESLYGIFNGDTTEAIQQLLNRPEMENPPGENGRAAWLYDHFLSYLTIRLKEDVIIKSLSVDLSMDEMDVRNLLGEQLPPMMDSLSQNGLNATYYSDDSFTVVALERQDEQLNFDWEGTSPDPAVPVSDFSVRWEGWLIPPYAETYTFMVDVNDDNDLIRVWIDDDLLLDREPNQSLNLEAIPQRPLVPGRSYRLRVDYQAGGLSAGVRLGWRTPAIPQSVIENQNLIPVKSTQEFYKAFLRLQRSTLMIDNFQLSTEEVAHFIQYPQDFGHINLTEPTFEHWDRLSDHALLRKKLRIKPEELIDIYRLAHMTDVDEDRFYDRLSDVTRIERLKIDAYITAKNKQVSEFVNEKVPTELHQYVTVMEKWGISIEQLHQWTQTNTTFTHLADVSQQVKRIVKMKYDPDTWLEAAPTLNDPIRNRQQQALIDFLLMQESLQEWGVHDADGLFEYFLIDVQMGACMDTSRVKQAISSVQLFIQRCLLNLESDFDDQNKEIGVSPSAIDTSRWEWMKNYRVWEANRKVFLFPENWLEPEWRDDKSPFFKELESELMQGDITQRTAEKALRGYLTKLETISKMDLVGQYFDPSGKILHLVGRTSCIPYKYYYRQLNTKYDVWTPWEKVDLDIKGEDDDLVPGVHVIPVVWNQKLYLFWPQFTYKELPANATGSLVKMGDKTQNELEGTKYWEVQLAWSEYIDSSWQPKQLFSKTITISPFGDPRYIDMRTRKVYFGSGRTGLDIAFGRFSQGKDWAFRLTNMFETPQVIKNQNLKFKGEGGTTSFMRKWGWGLLALENKVYLNGEYVDHSDIPLEIAGEVYEPDMVNANNPYLESFELLPTHQYPDFEKRLSIPVFFQDRSTRYYFRDHSWKDKSRFSEKHFGMSTLAATALNSTMEGNKYFESSRKFSVANQSDKVAFRRSSKSKGNTQMITQESVKLEESFASKAMTAMGNLRFDILYHPYVPELVGALNNGGITSLFEQQFSLTDDNGSYFKENYYPTYWVNKVYPKINMDFRREGAYSSYNWELFYHAPLTIAKHFTANNKFKLAEEWCHLICDPTTNEAPDPKNPGDRYWKFLPFRNASNEDLTNFFESLKANTPVSVIDEWRDKPFRPHLIARHRISAYMKKTVMVYLDNLIAWGDQLFRRDTMETINEATQLYVRATHILGRRPEYIPRRGTVKSESYVTLEPKLDAFSNAQVEMENLFPYSSEVNLSTSSESESLLGIGNTLYFCIPSNEDLLKYWDTVADRLFKIRHCMNIDGEVRQLSLFEPPIDPGALVKALASGLSIGSVLSDLNSPTPLYRFTYIVQKAMGLTQQVKSLGNQLLSAIEKGEAEHLSALRMSHELSIQMEMKQVLGQRIIEAENEVETLEKTWNVTKSRFEYYKELLGIEGKTVISRDEEGEVIGADHIELDVNVALRSLEDEQGVKLINREWEEIDQAGTAHTLRMSASIINALASAANVVPNFSVEAEPWGVGGSVSFGGGNLGSSLSAHAASFNIIADHHTYKSQSAARIAGYIRREQEWNFSANQAGLELKQIAKQIRGAKIRKEIAELELTNLKKQILRTEEIETYLTTKFANEELYLWMKEQISRVYKDSYNLAYELAKQAEKTFQFEFGDHSTNFVQYGYWNSAKEGLLAGDVLFLALTRMEKAYQDRNQRHYELTKHLSLSLINPTALLQLKQNGSCIFEIPELVFDMDHPGHYFRRIKSVSISIPCIVGPYASVSAKLTLMKNRIRKNGNSQSDYAYTGIEDSKFTHNLVGMQSIATSSAQGDSGMFELNFRDERYLPFEGAGAISAWKLELPSEFRSFNYDTISDVILHMNFTAREGGDALKGTVISHLRETLNKWMDEMAEEGTGLVRLFSIKQEFSSEWHRFLQPISNGENQPHMHRLSFEIKPQHLPYFLRNSDLNLINLTVAMKMQDDNAQELIINVPVTLHQVQDQNQVEIGTSIVLAGAESSANLPMASFDLEEDLLGMWRIQIDSTNLPSELKQDQSEPSAIDPNKMEDMFMILRYVIDV